MTLSLKNFIANLGVGHGAYMITPWSGISTITIAQNGKYRLTAVGQGGQGAIATGSNGGAAAGGGGGGFVENEFYLYAGDVLTLSIPAPILQNTANCTNGTAGSSTAITCAARGIAMTAGGGGGGAWSTSGASTASIGGTAAGGTGGGAWGGAINSTGGSGGFAYMCALTLAAAGGGAAGSPFGNGYAGGSVYMSTAGTATAGGGGIGGTGGGAGTHGIHGGGGGAGGPGGTTAVRGANKLGLVLAQTVTYTDTRYTVSYAGGGFESIVDPWRALTGGGGIGNSSSDSYGCGGGGSGGTSGSYKAAGPLGGCGGRIGPGVAGMVGVTWGGGGQGLANKTLTVGPDIPGNGVVSIERIG